MKYNPLNNKCEVPFSAEITRTSCCCLVGKAWGEPCQMCPQPNTGKYQFYFILNPKKLIFKTTQKNIENSVAVDRKQLYLVKILQVKIKL